VATRDWTVQCKDCLKPFHYSDQSARDARQRGDSRPERCAECRREHNKATSRMGAAYLDLDPGQRPVAAGKLKAGRLGRVDRGPRPHEAEPSPELAIPEGEFGITDDHIGTLLELMKDNSVIVIEAPTGSGKSTFLPWRLLAPPSPYPADHVTRHGTIVVTQPRIEATQGIPRYIASRLHGARVGAGLDIGFRHSRARDKADPRNRLVYATDGTLLNMIRRGELHACSVIVIDEAHERSLNIDLILALARRELIALPHLRLLVVSATINAASFVEFFRPELKAAALRLPGKEGKPVYPRWRSGPLIPEAQWPTRMPGEVARTAHEVLRWMACGEQPADIPASVPAYDGDILAFLPGKRAIAAAIDELTDLIDDDQELSGKVEVLPLYAELPQAERTRALERPGKKAARRWRVIMSTNLAETSLTVMGIRHVIDSGLINSTTWDVSTLTTIVRPRPHSKSGLLQRRGRAGRTDPGVWHCLFAREQFEALAPDTPPEITRAPLEGVIISAAAAGVSDPASLRWMPPGPPPDELRRAAAALRVMGAVTGAGDPTSLGSELAASRESFSAASLLMCADEAGVAIEAATVLAAVRDRRWVQVLRWGRWPAAARLHTDRLHAAMLSECADDLDAVLLLTSIWEGLPAGQQERFASRHVLSGQVLRAIVKDRETLLQSLQSRTKTAEVRPADPRLADRLRKVIAWSSPNSLYRWSGEAEGMWVPQIVPRSDADIVRRLHEGARPVLDSDSLLARREEMPPLLFALVRDRRRRWISPLQDPVEHVTLSFCVALRPDHIALDVPLIVHVAGTRTGRAPEIPVVLPGERMLVETVGPRAGGVQVRVLAMQSPMPVADVEVDTVSDLGEDTGDLAQREAPDADRGGLADDVNGGAADYLDPEEQAYRQAAGDQLPSERSDQDAVRDAIAGLDIVASRLDAAHPVVVVRSVTAAIVEADPDPAAVAEVFAERYQPGDECTVRVTSVRTLQRDRRRIVLTREESTGAEVLLTGIELGFGIRDASLEDLAAGTQVRLAVAAVESRLGLIQLTALPWTAATLSRLAEAGQEPFSGVIVDAADSSVYVLLTPDGQRLRADDPPITVEIRADFLPPRPAEMAIGQQVRVRLSPRRRVHAEAELDLPDLRLPTGPFERSGGALTLRGKVTARDVLAMYRTSRTAGLDDALAVHRALGKLTARALRPRGRIIDVSGLGQIQRGQRIKGAVVTATEQKVTVEVDGGTWATIGSEFLAWPGQEPPQVVAGETIDFHVTDVDANQGKLLLSLRDPARDPYARISQGDLLTGEVTANRSNGLVVWVADPGVEVFMPGRESGLRADQLADAIPPGSRVQFRLLEKDAAQRRLIGSRWIHQHSWVLPADILDLIRGERGVDPNRLRPVLGSSVNLRTDGSSLLLRWTDADADRTPDECLRALTALGQGMRARIAIPHPRPLDRQARDRLAAQFGCLMAIVRTQGTRVTWSADVIVPRHVRVEAIQAQIADLYPSLVRSGLQASAPGQFPAMLGSFKAAERARRDAGQPSSKLWPEKPYNYVELGDGDTYEALSWRLSSHGLALVDARWVTDHRIALESPPRPVMLCPRQRNEPPRSSRTSLGTESRARRRDQRVCRSRIRWMAASSAAPAAMGRASGRSAV
jgi:hypothetical protein